jgi:hypothetical protein
MHVGPRATRNMEPRLTSSRALMANLEHEMGSLLNWASASDAPACRTRLDPSHHPGRSTRAEPSASAHERHEELRSFLRGRADVNHKRAKRRELPEALGPVRLPREAAKMKRSGLQREVSYLSDRRGRDDIGAGGHVPRSLIPEEFAINLTAPLPLTKGLFAADSALGQWELNTETRKWETPIFPSKVPAGRRDVVLLHAWVNDMVARLKRSAGVLTVEEVLKEAQVLFSVAFHEIVRQASVHCLDRGHLMGKIWWSEMELFQRLLALQRRGEETLQRERAEHKKQVDALLYEMDIMRSQYAVNEDVVRTPQYGYADSDL